MDSDKKLLVTPSRALRPAAMSLLLLRFGELWLKSFEVRRRFTDRLITNISEAFATQKIQFKAIKSHDRIFFEVSENDIKTASSILSRTFGLVSFSQVEEIETDRKKITLHVLEIAGKIFKPKDTFAIRAKRTGTHEFGSQELERELGGAVIEKFGNRVNLTSPDKTISVEVREDKTYLFSEVAASLGGLPLGVEGKVAVIFQTKSEKASSVAKRNEMMFLKEKDYEKSIISAYLMMKRGCKVLAIFVASRISKKQKDAVALLSKYDPLIKYALIKSEKSAFAAARKNKARALVLPDTLAETLARKTRRFDKKTHGASRQAFQASHEKGVFALEPLIGFDEKKLKEMYGRIVSD